MKRGMFLMTVLAGVTMFVSCSSNDDDGGGGGQGNLPTLATLYATSNTNSKIASFNFTSEGIVVGNFNTSSNDNEGIFYNKAKDELVVNSRTQKAINTYSNVKNTTNGSDLNLLLSSNSALGSPRDIAVKDDFYVVSDNEDMDGNSETDEGRFLIFKRDENGYVLRNTVTVDYAVWGIKFIGNDLYTAVDKTGDVAVLKDFISTYTTDAPGVPDKRVTIEGLNRIHGIAEDGGFVVLTDIGDSSNESDGGFHFISGFVSKFDATPDGGVLSLQGNQVRVSGRLTQLGNPVAVDYDNQRNSVFIAERSNGNGKVLFFEDIGAGGELLPKLSVPFEGASSLYFINR